MAVAPSDQADADGPRPPTLEALFLTLESPLLAYALRLVRRVETAEDLVQEAFLRLQRQYAGVANPRAWLYRTVHNLALNDRRRAGKVVSMDADTDGNPAPTTEVADPNPLPDEEIARWERIGQVRLSLEGLDARSRELIRLKFEEDLSYKEIGARTGLKIGYVGYLLHHALKSVAADLAKAGLIP